ncbi:protein ACCELERATED CELL DEATH 6-like [Pyrus x bretschneideri]|uniref:protein ACCELERATED CELL DEATH 6-like n=1 Tax=Pyrus x bretschneideri TaxID=225117 RepID=UPI00202E2FA5|nr:protein ACCELERATED CELL DEATH 6-like [Pyrus x bretschneideri]
MAASSLRQCEIAMEDVGWSSRQDDPTTGEGAHEHAAGDTEAVDTRIDPILYRYATTYKPGVIFQCICLYQKFIRAMPTKYFAGATSAIPICNIPEKIVVLVQSSGNKATPGGNTVLHLAASTGHVQLIKLIAQNFPGLVRKQNGDRELPLHVAASAGHLSAVHCLVDTQGDMFNEEDRRGNTPLHVAVENNHQEVAMFLVGKDGSTSHSKNNSGKTPLCIAAEAANLDLVEAMVAKTPADDNSFWQGSNGSSILRGVIIWRKKARGGLNSNAVFVLSYLINPFSLLVAMLMLSYFFSPLFLLVAILWAMNFEYIFSQWWLPRTNGKNYTDLLEKILGKMDSALINSTDQEWMNHLTLAAFIGNFVAVRVLLDKFTGLAYKKDENQFLPIHVASKKGHRRVVEEFLKHCPDLREACDDKGRNILHAAAAHGRDNVVRYIIGKCDLQVLSKQRDKSGNTPLHIAVQNWHPKIVKILCLFHARANLNSLNDAGMTALDLAENTEVDKEMLFRRKLTLMALNLANAPRSEERTSAKAKLVTEDSVLQSLHNSDNLMFSKESVNIFLLVSTLVVGITFVQGFTIPGGYNSSGNDVGTPTFLTHILFKIFLICNTMAMCGSITASIALMWAQTDDPNIIHVAMKFTLPVLGMTLTMMSLSFLAGVALIVYNLIWLRIFVIAMGLFITVFIVGLLAPLIDVPVSYETGPTRRAILFFSFDLLMFASRYNFDDDWSSGWSL